MFVAPLAAPVRLPTVAKWKVVKKKVKLRPRKVCGCATGNCVSKEVVKTYEPRLIGKSWHDPVVFSQKSECAKKHVGCTTHPELPPPPPQYTVIQVH